jgi:restriction system protein
LTYFDDRRALVVDYGLPSFDSVPRVQEVRYAENNKAFKEILFPRSWQDDFYEQLIYNITLKTLYELFQSDSANALETAVFNGFVRTIDLAVGREVKAYMISVQATKQEFLALNLSHVDPKACIRRLKGSASERMAEPIPIEPLPSP